MSDFRTPWPRSKGEWTQATGVCDARALAWSIVDPFFFPLDALQLTEFAAHDVRSVGWFDGVEVTA